jgi:microcystin-dependent protein
VAVGIGQGPGLSEYFQGQEGGESTVTLIATEIPVHSHRLVAVTAPGTTAVATNNRLAKMGASGTKQNSYSAKLYSSAAPNVTMSPVAITPSGGSQPHQNMMPSMALNYCIALEGIFPSRK